MKTITIDNVVIPYDDTLVIVVEREDEVLVEAVSHFDKVSRMPRFEKDVDTVKQAVEDESAEELKIPYWELRHTCSIWMRKSAYPYDKENKYWLSLPDGWFRSGFPSLSKYSRWYFNRLLAKAGFEFNLGMSSNSRHATLIQHANNAKLWLKMGLIQKTDSVYVESRYQHDSFTTTFGTLIGFSYAKNPSAYYNKHFRIR